jgi:surface antigen
VDAATDPGGRRAIGWYASLRADGRWISARREASAYAATAFVLALPGLGTLERSWYWRTISPHALTALLLVFWCFCAIGAAVAWQLWRAPAIPAGAGPARAPDPHVSLARWVIAVVVALALTHDTRVPDANIVFVTEVLVAVSGYHFGRALVLGRRERTSASVILRPRRGRRLGRGSRIAVPAPAGGTAPSPVWRRLVASAIALSAVAGLWSLGTPAATAAAPRDAYPYRDAPKDVLDRWGFETRECTSYVAWRLNRDDGIGFTTHYGGALWWNAAEWLTAAERAGVPADADATPGSVMVLQPGVSGAGPPGHVAIVVAAGHGWVLVDDYNTNDAGRFSRHWIKAAPFPGMAFLHFPAAAQPR